MSHDVFISHSTKDKDIADAICAALERHGIRAWIAPRDILPGQDWGESIINAINEAKVMVLIFTAAADASKQVLREVERAVAKGVGIIPFRAENVLPSRSMEYFLSATHWLDAYTPPLETHLDPLARTVELMLKNPEEVAARAHSLKRIAQAADLGDAQAQHQLGLQYESGHDVPQDIPQAIRWFTKAAEQGHAEAQFHLGNLHEQSGDRAAAFRWYSRSARQNHQEAVERLAAWQNEPAPAGAIDDATEPPPPAPSIPAAPSTVSRALWPAAVLAGLLGIGLVAVYLLVRAPVHGTKAAALSPEQIAQLFVQVQHGEIEALNTLRSAAEQKNAAAEYLLGRIYDNGYAVIRDEQEALKWYRQSVEHGSVDGQLMLARAYEAGVGMNPDKSAAASGYRKAAQQGSATAALRLAQMSEAGDGTAQDLKQATSWYEQAAAGGSASAQFRLGQMYEHGQGVEKDTRRAADWYEKAAKLSYYPAQKSLVRLRPMPVR